MINYTISTNTINITIDGITYTLEIINPKKQEKSKAPNEVILLDSKIYINLAKNSPAPTGYAETVLGILTQKTHCYNKELVLRLLIFGKSANEIKQDVFVINNIIYDIMRTMNVVQKKQLVISKEQSLKLLGEELINGTVPVPNTNMEYVHANNGISYMYTKFEPIDRGNTPVIDYLKTIITSGSVLGYYTALEDGRFTFDTIYNFIPIKPREYSIEQLEHEIYLTKCILESNNLDYKDDYLYNRLHRNRILNICKTLKCTYNYLLNHADAIRISRLHYLSKCKVSAIKNLLIKTDLRDTKSLDELYRLVQMVQSAHMSTDSSCLKQLSNIQTLYEDVLDMFINNLKSGSIYSQFNRHLEYTDDFYNAFKKLYKDCDQYVPVTNRRDLLGAFKNFLLLSDTVYKLQHYDYRCTNNLKEGNVGESDFLLELVKRNPLFTLDGYMLATLTNTVGFVISLVGDSGYVVFAKTIRDQIIVHSHNLTETQIGSFQLELSKHTGISDFYYAIKGTKSELCEFKIKGNGASNYKYVGMLEHVII